MTNLRRILHCLLLWCLVLPSVAHAETPTGRTSLGLRFGDRLAEGYLDLILPVVGGASDLLFFNPRFGLGDESANELNLGLGYRHAFGGRSLVGGNVYFDSRRTQFANRFSQVGVGLEFLSTWVDVRGNYYLPVDDKQLADAKVEEGVEVLVTEKTSLTYGTWGDPYAYVNEIRQDVDVRIDTARETTTTTTKKTFEDWESAREGYDAEIGFLVPIFGAAEKPTPALRVFAGYYHFEDDFGDLLAGPKGRLEFRALPYLTFDVEVYQDKELYGSGAIAGVRLHTPFDFGALFQGKSPFPAPAATGGAAARMNEMVMRDVRVQTDTSGLAENESLRQVTTQTQLTRTKEYATERYVLLGDVIFVDNENGGDPAQDGTAEHPYDRIQQGADSVFGLRNLYVYASPDNYVENVVLRNGTTMIGQGTAVVGRGGKVYGGDAFPVITARATSRETLAAAPSLLEPVVTLANDTTVTGFTIEQGLLGIVGIGVSGAVTVTNNNVVGPGVANIVVVTEDDATVNISDNYVEGGLIGIGLLNLGGQLSAQVNDNEVYGTLIGIGAANLDIEAILPVANLDFTDFVTALELDTAYSDVLETPVTDIAASGNQIAGCEIGVGVANVGFGTMNATFDGNTIENTLIGIIGLNLGPAITVNSGDLLLPSGALSLTATNNQVTNSAGFGLLGIGVVNLGAGTTSATIGGVGAGNSVNGFELGIAAANVSLIRITDRDEAEAAAAPAAPTLTASIVGNDVGENTLVGIGVGGIGNAGTSILIDDNDVAAPGIGVGIGSIGISLVPDALGLDTSAFAPPEPGGLLGVTLSNNRIGGGLVGVGVIGAGNSNQSVSLSANTISGEIGVFGWAESNSLLALTLENSNIVNAAGPGIVVSAHDSSLVSLEAANNYIRSEFGHGIVLRSRGSSVVSAILSDNGIDAEANEIRGHLFGTGTVNLTANGNRGADNTFLVRLINDGGTFTYSGNGGTPSAGGSYVLSTSGSVLIVP